MLSIRRKAAQCVARPGGYGAIARYATDAHAKGGHDHGHDDHGHHHSAPKDESLGVRDPSL
jgi:hypothetical protein